MIQSLPMALPADRLESRIPDLKPRLTEAQATAEANRCLYCYDAPCIQACPTAINIPEFIKRIATGNVAGAAETILEANILGHSCASVCPVEVLCAGSCVYNRLGEPPIMIGRLQRHATEYAYDRGLRFFKKGRSTGKRVALVGAGPASLACAHELTRLGHEAVIFEGRKIPGGLNATGVAPYKLHAEEALREVAYVQAIGFEIRTGTQVGRDLSFEQLTSDFDAVFLGMGLGPDSQLGLPGEDLPGCIGAVALIERLKNESGFRLPDVHHAVVIGGGNTAIDAVRELKHLGVPQVTMVYRRGEAEMSGYAHELKSARQEGVELCFWAAPVAVEGQGRASALRCERTRKSASGSLEPIPGSAFTLEADLVVKATGQEKLATLLAGLPGVTLERGRVVVDAQTGRVGKSKFFAGGDCANGGKEVVNAAAEGKRAARGMDAFFKAAARPVEREVTVR
ncbi:Glutamate synthase [NADPH] small chain [compost metagenome]